MKKSLVAAGLALIMSAGFTLEAAAQARPAALVKQRQAVMTLHGKYFYSLRPMADGKAPYDAAIFARNAAFLEVLSKMPWDGFTPATAGEKSATLPEAYSDAAKFKAAADNYQAEAAKFAAATTGGNEQAVKTAYSAVAKACDTCHDSFRAKP